MTKLARATNCCAPNLLVAISEQQLDATMDLVDRAGTVLELVPTDPRVGREVWGTGRSPREAEHVDTVLVPPVELLG
jgi:hypothetical protein